jgi:hypothetical protein
MINTIPKIHLGESLYHVGTLNPQKKRDGYEGAGLSISTHPNAWMRIARGHVAGDIYQCIKAGNEFLNAHFLSPDHAAEIKNWGIETGYLTSYETVSVSWFDDEMEDTVLQTFASISEAREEFEDLEDFYDVSVDQGGVLPTEKLKNETRQTQMDLTGLLDFVLPLYAEKLGLDGVWWQDRLDVVSYSAPRGVIVPSKLESWGFTCLKNGSVVDPEDDEITTPSCPSL